MFPFAAGAHFETANVRNLLLAAGVDASEAMCLGIGGGIAAGYQYCPSVQKYYGVSSSGVQFVPRVKMMTTNGAWYRDTFSRVGVAMDVRETTGKKAARENLEDGLAAGKMVVAWTTPSGLALTQNWMAACGMYTVLVREVAGDVVRFSDHVSVREIGLAEFAAARERVCSLKNRTMTVTVGKRLDWKGAVRAGLQETAGDFVKPRLGTFNLPGLKEGVSAITGKGKRAWPVVFPGRLVILPMLVLYESIELGTGGGLMRPLYASFLEEAAKLLGKAELSRVAALYRELGREWTAFADFLLPEPFAETKEAMALLAAGDTAQVERLQRLRESAFPWDDAKVALFLEELSARLGKLYEREFSVSRQLVEVAGKV